MNKIKKPLALLLALMMLMTAMPLMAVPASASSWQYLTEDGKFYLYVNGFFVLDDNTVITYYGVDGTIDDITLRPVAVNPSTAQFDTTTRTAGKGDITGLFETSATSRGAHSYYFKGTSPYGGMAKNVTFQFAYKFDGTNYTDIDLCYLLSYKNGVLTFTFPEKSAVSALSSAAVDGSNVTANATVSGNTVSIPLDKALGGPIPVTLSLTADGSNYTESYEIYLNKDGTATDGYTTDGEAEEDPGVDLSMLETGTKIQFGTQNVQPVNWVIGGDGTTGMSVPEGCIALISRDVAFGVSFDNYSGNEYVTSNLRFYIENYISFSTDEQSAIQSRTLETDTYKDSEPWCDGVAGDSVTDKVWAPTTKDAYALKDVGLSVAFDNYWLCSPGSQEDFAAYATADGSVCEDGDDVLNDYSIGSRVALYIDLSKVYGTTAVEGKENTYTLNLTAPEDAPDYNNGWIFHGTGNSDISVDDAAAIHVTTDTEARLVSKFTTAMDGTTIDFKTNAPNFTMCLTNHPDEKIDSPNGGVASYYGILTATQYTGENTVCYNFNDVLDLGWFVYPGEAGDGLYAECTGTFISKGNFIGNTTAQELEIPMDTRLTATLINHYDEAEGEWIFGINFNDGTKDYFVPFPGYGDLFQDEDAGDYHIILSCEDDFDLFAVNGQAAATFTDGSDEEPHTHAFSKDWSKDETAHWHVCTAEGCDIEDYSECVLEAVAYGTHTYVDGVCSVCGFCTHPGFEGNTCTGCGVEFYRPYGVDYTDSAITFRINVLNDEKAEPFLAFGPCVRFDAFLIAGNSGSKIDLDLNFEKNGYYDFCIPVRDKDIFGINENDSGYCVKSGETYDVSIIAAKLDSIKNFSAENPYVWLVLRPCSDSVSLDYDAPDAIEFYVSAVCLGKFASLDDLHNLKLAPSHTFDEEWSNDANAHWHACTEENCSIEDYATCGIDEVAYGEHIGMDDDFTCDTCGYVNVEGQLANAVTKAKAALNTAKTNAKSDEAKAILDGAITALDEAESLDDVNTIKSDALENAKGADDALAEAIATAKSDLETAKENAKSDEAKDIIEDALAELDEATNLPAVSNIVEKANADAEEADGELAEAIATAKSDLEAAKTNAKSDEAKAILDGAIDALDEAGSLEDVETIVETAGVQAEEADNELAGAIATAKADLEAAKTEAVSDEAKTAIDEAIEEIEKATNPEVVAEAKADAETAATEADKALADAKEEAIEALEAAKTEAVSDEAKAAIDNAIKAVDEATNLNAVESAKTTGTTAAADADKALADAQAEAVEALEAAKEKAVSDEAKAALDEAIADVEKATNPTDAAAAKTSGLENAADADEALANAIEEAKEVLEEEKENAIADDAKEALEEAIEDMDNATSLSEVADKKAAAEEAAQAAEKELADAKAEAIRELEEAAGTERSAALKTLLKELEDEINSATNPEAAQAPVEEMLEEVEHQKTVDGFELPDEYGLLGYKKTTQLHGEAAIGKIVYTSSNTAVATVDENGLVTAVSKGECVITASVEGTDISDECKIEVKYNFFDILLYYILQIFSFIKNIFKSIFAF